MSDADRTITPGSLAARILDHLRVAKGEFEAGELAEDLHVELREVRAALETLKRAHAVSVRLDEGHPIYRAIGSEPKTIPGSAMKIIGNTTHAISIGADPATGQPVTPKKEETMPKHGGHIKTRPGHQEQVLAFLKATPGGASRQAVIKGTGLLVSQVRVALKTLHADGKVGRHGNTSNAIWHLPGEKVDPAANIRPPASRAPRKSEAKPTPEPSRVVDSPPHARNLAHFGPPSPVKPDDGFDFAVSSDGMFAIRPRGTGEPVRMGPGQVEEMIDFLTRTQNVWRPQA